MLSGSTNISVDGGVGVHMAAIALPNGSQGFVGITVSPMPGLAYLDPDNSTQVIYDANGTTTSDSFTFSYIDGMGMTDTYTVNVTITGTGSGSGSGSGASSGSASDSASGSGSGSANSASSGSGSGSGSASGTSSVANTVPTIATLTFMKSIASGGVVDGWCEGTLSDATLSDRYAVQIDTLSAATGDPMETYPSTLPVYNDPAEYELHDPQRYASNYNDQLDNTPLTYTVGGVKIAVGKSHVWARAVEYPSGGGTFVYSNTANGIEFGAWQKFEVVTGTGPAPVAVDDRGSAHHGQVASGNVMGGIAGAGPNGESSDVYSGIPIFSILSSGSQGQAVITNPYSGEYTYTPSSDFVGDATFTYTLTDAYGSDEGEVTISFSNTVPEPESNGGNRGLHDRVYIGEVASNDNLISDGNGGWKDQEGDSIRFVLTSPLAGLYLDATTGGYQYYPASGVAGLGDFEFQYKLSDGLGMSSREATAFISIYNNRPTAYDVAFVYPEPGEFVEFDISELSPYGNFDFDGDAIQFNSVTAPTNGGAATIVGNKIRFTPSAAYSTDDPKLDVFAMGTEFTYTLTDNVQVSDVATITAAPNNWTPVREYSRGNDDQNEGIFETAKIKLELDIDEGSQKVYLIYTATGTTDIRLRNGGNGEPPIVIVRPGDADQGLPEYEFFQANLFLQNEEQTESTQSNPNPVPVGGYGENLSYAGGPMGGGTGSTLSARLEVGSYGAAGASGTAVIQMQGGGYFLNIRQRIPWAVTAENVGGSLKLKSATLSMTESQVPGRLPNDLRIVNSSNTNGLVYKLGFPDKAMQLQRNPASLLDPLNPPPDWTTMIKVRDRTA